MTRIDNEEYRRKLREARKKQSPPHPKGSKVSPEGRKHMSDAQREVRSTEYGDKKILKDFESGLSMKEIVEKEGVSYQRIHRVADENKIQLPPTGVRNKPNYQQAVLEAHNAGMSQQQIAKMLRIRRGTVRQIQKESGLSVRRGRIPGSTRRTEK